MRILIDINIPREVQKSLRELGVEASYLKDVLPEDTDDQEILKWMEENNAVILTKDKRFPETKSGSKIVLVGQSPGKLLNEAMRKLLSSPQRELSHSVLVMHEQNQRG